MLIEAYILCNNEERLMPYIMRHYSQFCSRVHIIESNSTDKTYDIALRLGAVIVHYGYLLNEDAINDEKFTEAKNTCWKGSKADWVIIADADEFVYHPNIHQFLSGFDVDAYKTSFYNMYSAEFPTTNGQIYDEVTMGVAWNQYGKINIFRPSTVKESNYSPGCHQANFKGRGNKKVLVCTTDEIKTLHMRNLSKQYTIDKVMRHASRMSETNKSHGWGNHVMDKTPEEIGKRFDEEFKQAIKII